MLQRQFNVRYANWNPQVAKVPGEKLVGKDSMGIVRAAMGHAFMEQLKGDWKDGPDIKVVIDKDSPGVWVGRRLHPQTAKKEEPFYIMEV